MKLSDERIRELRMSHKDIDSFIRAIEREAYRNGQEAMRERAAKECEDVRKRVEIDSALIAADSIRALEIEGPK